VLGPPESAFRAQRTSRPPRAGASRIRNQCASASAAVAPPPECRNPAAWAAFMNADRVDARLNSVGTGSWRRVPQVHAITNSTSTGFKKGFLGALPAPGKEIGRARGRGLGRGEIDAVVPLLDVGRGAGPAEPCRHDGAAGTPRKPGTVMRGGVRPCRAEDFPPETGAGTFLCDAPPPPDPAAAPCLVFPSVDPECRARRSVLET